MIAQRFGQYTHHRVGAQAGRERGGHFIGDIGLAIDHAIIGRSVRRRNHRIICERGHDDGIERPHQGAQNRIRAVLNIPERLE